MRLLITVVDAQSGQRSVLAPEVARDVENLAGSLQIAPEAVIEAAIAVFQSGRAAHLERQESR